MKEKYLQCSANVRFSKKLIACTHIQIKYSAVRWKNVLLSLQMTKANWILGHYTFNICIVAFESHTSVQVFIMNPLCDRHQMLPLSRVYTLVLYFINEMCNEQKCDDPKCEQPKQILYILVYYIPQKTKRTTG